MAAKTRPTQRSAATPEAIDVTPLRTIKIEDPRPNVEALLSQLEREIENGLHELKAYLGDMSTYDYPAPQFTSYNAKERTLAFTIHDTPPETLTIAYTVTKKRKGLFSKTWHATTLITSEAGNPAAFTYEIPHDGAPLSTTTLNDIVDELEQTAITKKLTPEQEREFIRTIANITGIPQLAQTYSSRKYTRLRAELNQATRAHFEQFQQASKNLTGVLKEKLEAVLANYTPEGIEKAFDKKKAEAEHRVLEEAQRLITELQQYEANFKTTLEKTREAQEKEHRERMAALAASEKEITKKRADLDARLASHREKLREDAYEIPLALARIFPDHTRDRHNCDISGYEQRVDGNLRKFYEQRLLNDLDEAEGITIDQTLKALELLKKECFQPNIRLQGRELRDAYAALRGIIDCVATHDITMEAATEKIALAAKTRGDGPRFTPEGLIELALPYDFDMKRYRKGLHPENARTRDDLGVK